MAATLQQQKIGRIGHPAAMTKEADPKARMKLPAVEGLQPARGTQKTSAGESSSPRLPEPATRPLAAAPASNHRTAISKRKVVPAVSRTPAALERHNSCTKVVLVRASAVMERLEPCAPAVAESSMRCI